MVSHGIAGSSVACNQHDVGAMACERAASDGTRDHARQIKHAKARERTIAFRPRLWRGLGDLLDRDQRQRGERLRVRRRGPFVIRAHHRDDAAGCISRGLEFLRLPLHQPGLDVVAFGLAVEHLADGGTVVRKIGVQPHETTVAGLVDAGDGIPRRWRRLAVDAQIALGTALDCGVAHVDGDGLRLPAAQLPDLGCGKAGRGDAHLRRGGDTKRGRQQRLLAGQRDGGQRTRRTARRCPDVVKNFQWRFSWTLHRHHSCLAFKLCLTD